MKRFIKTILPVFAFALLVLAPIINAQAKTITSLIATESDGKISVSGTAEEGTLAVAIMVYDSTLDNLITTQTTSVSSDNTYNNTITIENGNYIVKVADYDGGEYATITVTYSAPEDQDPTIPEDPNIKEDPEIKEDPSTNNNDQSTVLSEPENPAENDTSNNVQNIALDETKNPKTGDNIFSNLIVVNLLILIGTLGICYYIYSNKKEH